MAPDELGSESWSRYMAECARVSNGRLIASDDISRELYIQTFGIKRLVVCLLGFSYLEARQSGRHNISVDDIIKASFSASYAISRADVNRLKEYAATGKMSGRARPDLICPLASTSSYLANAVSIFTEKRARHMEAKVLDASLTVDERSTLELSDPATSKKKPKAVVRTVTPKASDEELAANFIALLPKPKK